MTLPLSHEQEAHLLLGEGAYSALNLTFDVSGPLDAGLLRRAAEILVARHEALRLRLRRAGGELSQAFAGGAEADVPFCELEAGPGEAAGIIGRRSVREPDLECEPAVELTLVRTGPERCRVLLLVHHLCIDGWGAYLLAQELWSVYDQLARDGAADAGSGGRYGYGQYVRDQRAARDGTPRGDERRRRHWRELAARFADAAGPPSASLPSPRLADGDGPGRPRAQLSAGASPEQARSIAALAAELGISPNVIPLACFGLAVAAQAGAARAALWFSYAGRDRSALHQLVGLVYRRIPLVLECGTGQALGTFLQGAEREWYEAVRNSRLPYTPMAFLADLRDRHGGGAGPDILYNQVTYFGRKPGGETVTVGGGVCVRREDRYYDPERWAGYREPRLRIIGYADAGVLLRAIRSDDHTSAPATEAIMERTRALLGQMTAGSAARPLRELTGG